ncbi:MAG TPA: hypothetical protein VF092_01830 [Longimicrobium sp.]
MVQAQDKPEPLYKRWFMPGIIALGAAVVVLIVNLLAGATNRQIPIVASISILITAMVFTLSWTVEKNWTKIPDQLREDVSRIREDILAIAAPVRDPYLAVLREEIFERARSPLLQLTDKTRRLSTAKVCTQKLIEHVRNLDPTRHREILAVCGQKEWDSPLLQMYYEANYRRSLEGINVKRIFIAEPGKSFSDAEKRVLSDHLSKLYPNVEGRVIYPEKVAYLEQYKFPTGFGFAILGNVVIIHWGLGQSHSEAGRILEDPWFVEIHRQMFKLMWKHVAKGRTDEEKAEIKRRILGDPAPEAMRTAGGNA